MEVVSAKWKWYQALTLVGASTVMERVDVSSDGERVSAE